MTFKPDEVEIAYRALKPIADRSASNDCRIIAKVLLRLIEEYRNLDDIRTELPPTHHA